jgi:hypothetical protein
VIRSSRTFAFFEHFRVPYELATAASLLPPGLSDPLLRSCDVVRFGEPGEGRHLLWLASDGSAGGRVTGEFRLESRPIFGAVLPDPAARAALAGTAGGWTPGEPIRDPEGAEVAHVWRSAGGDVLLPFDPDELIHNFWSEGYKAMWSPSAAARVLRLGKRPYYRLRAALPRPAQIAMRRAFSRLQARTRFPRWPVETALDDVFAYLFGLAGALAGEPIPWIAPWPGGHEWAIVLTHDVETETGYRAMRPLCELEAAAGYRSSWNMVPGRYTVEDDVVDGLLRDGFEVGAHSMWHNGREFASRAALAEWLPPMREHARRWDATGFRSPATNRVWELMPLTGFEYDSSYPDSDPFEPTPGGCLSWLPYFNGDQVELPVTLPQDHTVFVILRREDESLWVEKATFLREQGGMALLIVHPDYMLEPARVAAYARFLDRFAGDDSAWRALPRDVSAWWRRRACSRIERDDDGSWRVSGPAAGEARIRFGLEHAKAVAA